MIRFLCFIPHIHDTKINIWTYSRGERVSLKEYTIENVGNDGEDPGPTKLIMHTIKIVNKCA